MHCPTSSGGSRRRWVSGSRTCAFRPALPARRPAWCPTSTTWAVTWPRILKAAGQKVPGTLPILEINPGHALVQRLDQEQDRFEDWANVLFEQALLAEGGTLEDPAGFVRRMNELMLDMAGGKSRIWMPGA